MLAQLGLMFEVRPANIEEVRADRETVPDFVARMALTKAQVVSDESGRTLPVLGADTVVVIDDEMLGKPASREQGLAMLAKLSGRVHEVFTAVSLVDGDYSNTQVHVSKVWFKTLAAHEREAYWETGEPADKAGAYAIQGIGAIFIEKLEGSFSGVMGLPLHITAQMLAVRGLRVPVISGASTAHA